MQPLFNENPNDDCAEAACLRESVATIGADGPGAELH